MRSSELLNLLWTAFRCRLLSRITFAGRKSHYEEKSKFYRNIIYSLNTNKHFLQQKDHINKKRKNMQSAGLTVTERKVFDLISSLSKSGEKK